MGVVTFRCHAQSCMNGQSNTKFCAYLELDGKPVPTRAFASLIEA